MQNNIDMVKTKRFCCSCGICAGVCPKNAISMAINKKTGELLPHVDKALCIECGNCLNICPGLSDANAVLLENSINYKLKQCSNIESYVGNITDTVLLENCTSGGIASELIRTLLAEKTYESVFLVSTNQYSDILKCKYAKEYLCCSSKSRYIAVSHEETVKYILSHRNEKVIIVAVGCAVNGFRKVIEHYRLNPENYLFIGLFCDKIMSYSIWDYFANEYVGKGTLSGMDFRNKKNSGWPGDMLLYFGDIQINIDRKAKKNVQRFFQNERCLYCTNKLNEMADISVGDNYTQKGKSMKGSSSIIVRTNTGKCALDSIRNKCTLIPITAGEIYESQKLDKRLRNSINAKIKFHGIKKSGTSYKDIFNLGKEKLLIKIGRSYSSAPLLMRLILKFRG